MHITVENINDKKFNEKKFMTINSNDIQFIELPKLNMMERKILLSSELDKLNKLKYVARKEEVVCFNKKKIYQY
jgi:hypothetical protein